MKTIRSMLLHVRQRRDSTVLSVVAPTTFSFVNATSFALMRQQRGRVTLAQVKVCS